ncbi:aromatic acid exporter family protein [Kitasatospora sp. NBC_00315]|uniref:FUSC family protein n=1 Tax=Kitasatospora sp. NBC_00315 TaxID=2975963 RepID=UPI0032456670
MATTDQHRDRPRSLSGCVGELRELGLRRFGVEVWRLLGQVVRPAAACALAWQAAVVLLRDGQQPVLAALAALLTVQLTVYRTLRQAAEQILGVVAGVGVAMLFFRQFGTHWLTLGPAVGVSLLLGRGLRLGSRAVEVPTTLLLVVGSGSSYGASRFLDTLIGTGAGALVCLLAPPSHLDRAARRIRAAGDVLASAAADIAHGTSQQWDAEQAGAWRTATHRAAAAIAHAREAVTDAREGTRLHPQRARRAARARRLEESLLCLDHVCDQMQAVARGLVDRSTAGRGLPDPDDLEDRLDLSAFSALTEHTAVCLRLFVTVSCERRVDPERTAELRQRLEDAGALAAEASRTLVGATRTSAPLWALHGSLLDETCRILTELDPDGGPHADAFGVPVKGTST